MPLRSADITVMVQAAEKAGRLLLRDFGEVEHLQVSRKGPGDFVSIADEKAERTIREHLQKARPGFGFLQEESGTIEGSEDARFIVDPLDGTTNFLHGLPHFAVSIGLEKKGELVAGVVFDPVKGELYTAERGQGAYLNNRRIRVSGRSALADAVVACGLPILQWPGRKSFVAEYNAVADVAAGIRRLGTASLDLAYVASGRFDGYWEYGLNPWDIAAGVVLVREAGGTVNRLQSDDVFARATLVAGNEGVHRDLSRCLQRAHAGLAGAAPQDASAT